MYTTFMVWALYGILLILFILIIFNCCGVGGMPLQTIYALYIQTIHILCCSKCIEPTDVLVLTPFPPDLLPAGRSHHSDRTPWFSGNAWRQPIRSTPCYVSTPLAKQQPVSVLPVSVSVRNTATD